MNNFLFLSKFHYKIDAVCSKDNTTIICGANHKCETLLDDYNVPENAVMVGIPARSVGIADSEFKPYGITPDSDKKSDNE